MIHKYTNHIKIARKWLFFLQHYFLKRKDSRMKRVNFLYGLSLTKYDDAISFLHLGGRCGGTTPNGVRTATVATALPLIYT